jgi:hypothetical protein
MARAADMNRPEQAIHRAVVQHLRMRGVKDLYYFHVPNGGFRRKTEAAIMQGLGTRAGTPRPDPRPPGPLLRNGNQSPRRSAHQGPRTSAGRIENGRRNGNARPWDRSGAVRLGRMGIAEGTDDMSLFGFFKREEPQPLPEWQQLTPIANAVQEMLQAGRSPSDIVWHIRVWELQTELEAHEPMTITWVGARPAASAAEPAKSTKMSTKSRVDPKVERKRAKWRRLKQNQRKKLRVVGGTDS